MLVMDTYQVAISSIQYLASSISLKNPALIQVPAEAAIHFDVHIIAADVVHSLLIGL